MNSDASNFDRYRRQVRFAPLGEVGQARLAAGRALVVGCGALGGVIAELLVRAGVGFMRLVDRDFVELDNLHRQVLFTEQDAAQELPKAVAAQRRLAAVNSSVTIEAVVADLNFGNIGALAHDVQVIVDGTDNFETRYLVNDFAVATGKPWVFAGCVGAEGQTLTVLPGESPCLACLMPAPPPATALPTCETAGVLGPIVTVIASIQAAEVIKLLSGNREAVSRRMTVVDVWHNELRSIGMAESRNADCAVCSRREFDWLEGRRGSGAIALCGRNSVQISPTHAERVDLDELAGKFAPLGTVTSNAFLVRLAVGEHLITVFADGRTIVGGTDDVAVARTLHARYVGS